MEDRISNIKQRLSTALNPVKLEVIDDSQQHVGHAGAASGAGHFTVIIQSAAFNDISLVERHKLVYQALNDMMDTEIHALSIKAEII